MFQGIAHRAIVQMCTTEPDLSAERPSCGLSSSRNRERGLPLLSCSLTFIFSMPCLFSLSLISIFYAPCLLDASHYKPSCGLFSVQNEAALLSLVTVLDFYFLYVTGLLQYTTRLVAVCPATGLEQQGMP